MKNTWRARLKPLEVEREIRDDLPLSSSASTSKNWSYRYWKDGEQCRLRLAENNN
jgi:hypothetical protein